MGDRSPVEGEQEVDATDQFLPSTMGISFRTLGRSPGHHSWGTPEATSSPFRPTRPSIHLRERNPRYPTSTEGGGRVSSVIYGVAAPCKLHSWARCVRQIWVRAPGRGSRDKMWSWIGALGGVAELVENRSGVISGLNFPKPNRRLAAADGDNANVDRYIKRPDW
jgi:hypothetical protein